MRLTVWPDYRLRMDILSGIKRTSALPWVMAAQAARQHGTDDALLLDLGGNLAEASAANIFMLVGNRLLTPPLQSGCLPGIMRAEIMRLAPTLGYTVAEEPLPPVVLGTAQEVFLTNALRGCIPVESVRTTSRLYGFGPPSRTSAVSRFQQLLLQLWGLGE
jgi:branched-subunit amino acid aminotransferase/4-amino-4-deoxychorismate lyase